MPYVNARCTVLMMVALVMSALLVPLNTALAQARGRDLAPLPQSFQFGVSSAGFQSEGHNKDSNWLRYSNSGRVAQRVNNAVDFFDQYEGDIARARSMGVSIYRLSVEWSRVEPRPGFYDPAAWAYYDRVMTAIKKAGMTPMITLNHWVHPGWEVDRGGWNRGGMAEDFVQYANMVIDRYESFKPYWITFNEPTEYVRREVMYGGLSIQNAGRMADGIVRAHRAIYAHAHQVQPGAQVSSNMAFLPIPVVQGATESVFQKRMVGAMDFIGVDQYYSLNAGDYSVANVLSGDLYKASQAPESMYYVLRYIARQYPGTPIRVIENGLAMDRMHARPDGYTRVDNLRDTVYWIQRARADGIPIVSYNYWSITDNYEWGSYNPQFGLFSVDPTDPQLRRIPTPAVEAYRQINRDHGVGKNFIPSRRPQPCSLVDAWSSCTEPVAVP